MNGTVPSHPGPLAFAVPTKQRIQVMPHDEIALRRRPEQRLPRQVQHYERLVDHILQVKDSAELRRSLAAHFARLTRYHEQFLEPPNG